MRKIIAATALVFAVSTAAPALAGEGGCSWSTRSVSAPTTSTTQTAETTAPTTPVVTPNGG